MIKLVRLFIARVRGEGFSKAVKYAFAYLRQAMIPSGPVLSLADPDVMFAENPDIVRKKEKKMTRANTMLYDASHVAATYPEIFKSGDRILRYSYRKATGESKGLIVMFHGFNAFIHLGGSIESRDFDVLSPWDTFGWNRQGSWFWGEKGVGFVEPMVWELIRKHRDVSGSKPWFCMGSSMGGFASLYYGIKYQSDGIYAMAPQVDLKLKIQEYGADNRDNPYGYLMGADIDTVPDLLNLAEQEKSVPPLFLVQNQYDSVNVFSRHGFRLLDVYNRKKAWYGMRIYPAIGHGGDGTYAEAMYFFKMLADKKPARSVGFSFV